MADNAPDLKELKAIIDWVNVAEDVRELSLKFGDVELHVSRGQGAGTTPSPAPAGQGVNAPATEPAPPAAPTAPAPAPVAPAPAAAAPAVAPAPAAADPAVPGPGEVLITAPMVGVFYAAPQPGARPFVEVGDAVQADTVLGIVEVMKLMNNIEARVAGTVVRVLAQNESLVEYGQPLMVIQTSA
ncbi:acetyl-CoA carboxylase biotin carboxyl carrier protein [Arthrobacter sp.]|uniref:acetyl-CoA carboxylase biotin carboxyl carrier protein n=1 Tax=Arthrobacter sp. TaxID=1667 RepID=UPI0025890208|nr:acetyl-CoA carboxylase biotin carboxyl carrier protein [Arthrobacter sp.]